MQLMKISTHNEWDSLRTIVVGSATDAGQQKVRLEIPEETTLWRETPVPSGPADPQLKNLKKIWITFVMCLNNVVLKCYVLII